MLFGTIDKVCIVMMILGNFPEKLFPEGHFPKGKFSERYFPEGHFPEKPKWGNDLTPLCIQ